MTSIDEILDDLFQGCAFAAFVEQARLQQGPPCPELTRRLAYELYEEALANRTADETRCSLADAVTFSTA